MESPEVIIIGGGPAGISCALELQDSNISYLVLEREQRIGGQLWSMKSSVRNFIGGYAENGSQTAERLEKLVEKMSANVQTNAIVEQVDLKLKSVTVNGARHKAQAIVIATGYRVKELRLPGSEIFSKSVYYTSKEKEEEFRGKNVAIIGGGDSAFIQSLELSEICPKIYLIHRSNKLRARPDLIDSVKTNKKIEMLLDTEVDSLIGQKTLTGLQVISSHSGEVRDIDAQCILIKVGYTPNTELFRGQVNMDSSGHIQIDRDCSTSVAGIYAVGDLTKPGQPRIATAAGQGVLAAHTIQSYLQTTKKISGKT
ncbi:MAG TPA: NAD(P)/FAD-dependent oxidoreductase [Drouetiella sp.]